MVQTRERPTDAARSAGPGACRNAVGKFALRSAGAQVHKYRAARISDGDVPGNVAGVQRRATRESIRARAVTSEAMVCLFARRVSWCRVPSTPLRRSYGLLACPAWCAAAGRGVRAFVQVALRRARRRLIPRNVRRAGTEMMRTCCFARRRVWDPRARRFDVGWVEWWTRRARRHAGSCGRAGGGRASTPDCSWEGPGRVASADRRPTSSASSPRSRRRLCRPSARARRRRCPADADVVRGSARPGGTSGSRAAGSSGRSSPGCPCT